MIDDRTPEQRLRDECARWRRTLREEESRHADTRTVLQDANRMLLSVYLRERFTDPVDFTDRVPLEHLVDEAGRIAWDRVALLADELLEARPHLATPEERAEAQCPPGGLQWLATET